MNKRICVLQDDLKDCGICCLLTIIKYYHGDVPKEYLREITKTTKDGVSAFYLIKAAQELGFSTKALQGDINLLENSDFPIIAHTIINNSFQHFVVVYEIRKDYIIIADPSYGIKKISLLEWNKISTSKYLILKPNKKLPIIKFDNYILKILVSFILKNKMSFITIICLSLIYTIMNIITSYNFKLFMDEVNFTNKHSLKIMLIIMLLFGLVKNLSNLFRNKLINFINTVLDKTLVNGTYSQIIYLPYLYYKTRTCGDIITRINDIASIKELLERTFLTFFVDLILMFFVILILFSINKNLTYIVLLIAFIYCLVTIIYNKVIHKYVKESYEKSSSVNSYLVETINSVDTIKGLHIEDKICNKFSLIYNQLAKINKNINNILYDENFFEEFLYYCGNIIIIYYGIILVIDKKINITTLITYINLFSYFLEPIKNILNLSFGLKTSIISVKRITELYSIPKEEFKISNKTLFNHLEGNIQFINVSYSYNGINNVISNINLVIKKGEKVLISGDSGSGKSTLVKLIMKYINDYTGKIYLDNRELNSYELHDIRKNICYVSQSEILFTDTIYNNIVLERNITYEEFLYACKIMKVNDIVDSLPLKYDSLIEENGFNLSSGQRQRIILARTILKNADIYIFDEALNAIDIKRERIILKNLFKIFPHKTIIVVSHRFNNEDLFDKKIKLGECFEY